MNINEKTQPSSTEALAGRQIIKLWGPVIIIVFLFLLFSYFAQQYSEFINATVQQNNFLGIFSYILISIIAIVIAPISAMPLLPIAASIWGGFWAGLFSITGWTIGSMIAFFLAQKYGHPLVRKLASIKKIEKIEKRIPTQNIFWTIVFLRMSIPVDILSYALGLFTNVSYTEYFFATLLGITPFAFIFAYAGTFPLSYQIAALVAGVIVFLFGLKWVHHETRLPRQSHAWSSQIILWILAVIVIFAVATLLGWKVFYGYVVPQANNLGTLSTVGIFAFAGIAGLMANFGPCSLAVLPAYMSFYLGMEDTNGGHSPIRRSLKLGLIASLGVVSFFIVLGLLLAVIGTTLTGYVSQLKFVVAALIFLAGISMIKSKSIRLPFLERFRDTVSKASEGRSRAIHLFAFGIIYGAGGLMCFLPIFLPLVFFPFVSGAFLISVVSFVIFSLGQALFLTTATVFIGQGKHTFFKPIMARTGTMKKVAGWILILTSLWMTVIFFIWGM